MVRAPMSLTLCEVPQVPYAALTASHRSDCGVPCLEHLPGCIQAEAAGDGCWRRVQSSMSRDNDNDDFTQGEQNDRCVAKWKMASWPRLSSLVAW